MRRRISPDLLSFALLFALPLVMFWQQTVGGRTLLPTENFYRDEPFATYREVVSAPEVPHNGLLDDLVLENLQWKTFIRQNIAEGEIPLWNPHQFAGIPFMAAGQQSTLYPLSLLYYILPLPAAYGWYTVANLWLAGVFMYLLGRSLGVSRAGSALAGVVYQLSGFMLASVVFQMIIGAAVWLPLLLLMIEYIVRGRPFWGRMSAVPWLLVGALALACNIFAGHVELTYYTLIIMAYYAAARLGWAWWTQRQTRDLLRRGALLAGMVALGFGLGAVQFVPLFELVSTNWRSESAALSDVLGWAHPPRDVVQFVLPNFYGSPAHHSYFDVFSGQTVSATVNALGQPISIIDWGIKNYVEGALYLGILPLALAVYSLVERQQRAVKMTFLALAILSLTFMFGLPTYALLYYGFPGLNQSHTPFRWIYALALAVALLSAFGLDALAQRRLLARQVGIGLLLAGGLVLLALLLSRLFYAPLEPLVEQVLRSMAKANEAFADARMFYSYQFGGALVLGVVTLGAGFVFWWAGRSSARYTWAAVALTAVDLMIASWGFNPASDPALLDFTPPAIQWLQQQPGDWRYTTLDDPAQPRRLLNANAGWRYGLDDIRGYESIIPKQYVSYMQRIAPQVQLEFNRIAPLYTGDDYHYAGGYRQALESPYLRLLNVRFVMTHKTTFIDAPGWTLAYEDEAVRIWENPVYAPRAFTLSALDFDEPTGRAAEIIANTGREKEIALETDAPVWLVVSETYFPGWRAFIRPHDANPEDEQPLDVTLVLENFQGVFLPESGRWIVRLVYSPASFQVGLFGSLISGALLVFMGGVWFWRAMVSPPESSDSSISRVARNSIAPILLNLFNRGIDFAFAFVMLRILGPENSGIYTYAAFIFIWFDIFTNFGLNTYLTREVARDRSQAWRYFYNTSVLRLLLVVAGVPLLLLFLLARQTAITPPLSVEALLAIGLLYAGLLPNSLSTGMSALFYAFEKAEYPAAIATLSTLSKTTLGLAALLLGYGVVGLAAVSIITNIVTLAVMVYAARDLLGYQRGQTQRRPDTALMRRMTGQSAPLMLNHFLATIFFQIDVVIIEAIHGARMVGQYGVAYKWLAALNVIPAFFTMALLPVMSRQAHEDREALRRTYALAVKLLISVALPVAAIFTFTAYFLTGVLGGAEFLPDSAIATQLMIWSIPIGWINSLTQYVLIALDLQSRITRAFLLAVSFNILSNLLLIPAFGYRAAALTTIASELVLLIPFALLLQTALGRIGWLGLLWRPVVATGAMLGCLALLWEAQPVGAALLSLLVYGGVLLALRPLTNEEYTRLTPLLPARLRRT